MKKLITGMAIAALFLSACNNKSSTTAAGTDSTAVTLEKNKQTALKAEEAFNTKDVDAMYKDCAADYVDHGNGEMGSMKNIDSLKTSMKTFLAAFSDLKVENLKAVAGGDTVVVFGDWSGTFTKEFMGLKPTNKSFKTTDADIFTFNKEGKMTSHRSIQSEATYFAQLGITMPAQKK